MKDFVTNKEVVSPNVKSICNLILAKSSKQPATTDNIMEVYPQVAKKISERQKKGQSIVGIII